MLSWLLWLDATARGGGVFLALLPVALPSLRRRRHHRGGGGWWWVVVVTAAHGSGVARNSVADGGGSFVSRVGSWEPPRC